MSGADTCRSSLFETTRRGLQAQRRLIGGLIRRRSRFQHLTPGLPSQNFCHSGLVLHPWLHGKGHRLKHPRSENFRHSIGSHPETEAADPPGGHAILSEQACRSTSVCSQQPKATHVNAAQWHSIESILDSSSRMSHTMPSVSRNVSDKHKILADHILEMEKHKRVPRLTMSYLHAQADRYLLSRCHRRGDLCSLMRLAAACLNMVHSLMSLRRPTKASKKRPSRTLDIRFAI